MARTGAQMQLNAIRMKLAYTSHVPLVKSATMKGMMGMGRCARAPIGLLVSPFGSPTGSNEKVLWLAGNAGSLLGEGDRTPAQCSSWG
ncbi:hypothetical protein JTE90_020581 [Oedothorax gibbosus]|uniref:Uncharacterized protein n=1 Tax=Oedothorax gibbosus TaxID=931172 RepID=A0AAV6VYN2_9ARAC|nr:hypothetical protein JTE90_020581 [Oedothorax gibbosus]